MSWIPFSKRDKPLPDVYKYDKLPGGLRNQIDHLWSEVFGGGAFGTQYGSRQCYPYSVIAKKIAKEHGLKQLADWDDEERQCREYLEEASVENCLDLIEYSFLVAGMVHAQYGAELSLRGVQTSFNDAVVELNHRFREHGCGYQLENCRIIRIDSQYVHVEVTQPTLSLISGKAYAGAQQEFLEAHEHYRHGRHKDAIATCRKAFESTMKAICDARGWQYDKQRATAKDLIKIMFDQKLIPVMMQSYFDNLRGLMESCVPTIANKTASHGQGAQVIPPDETMTSYVLHQTASNMLLLAKYNKRK
ncbi:MAG: STM4504/CBY_0614 family protein [Candidatus Sumerlaeaceae bacterium]